VQSFEIGDLCFTNFFGEPHRAVIILKVNRNPYGIVSYLTLLSGGKQLYLKPDALITVGELGG
jgi:hypothetical protein